jgi:hypothetical protein
VASVIEDLATAQDDSVLFIPAESSSKPLSRVERLLTHFIVFLIGSWNLIVVGLARGLNPWWGLGIVLTWTTVLIGHGLVVAVRSSRIRWLTHKPSHRAYGNALFVDPRATYTRLQVGPGGRLEVKEVKVR